MTEKQRVALALLRELRSHIEYDYPSIQDAHYPALETTDEDEALGAVERLEDVVLKGVGDEV